MYTMSKTADLQTASLNIVKKTQDSVESAKTQILITGDKISDLTKQKWEPIQKTLDEKGVTNAVKMTGEGLNKGVQWTAAATVAGVNKLNQAVDANPTLKSAKDQTAKGIAIMSSSVSSWFGWGKKKEEVKETEAEI